MRSRGSGGLAEHGRFLLAIGAAIAMAACSPKAVPVPAAPAPAAAQADDRFLGLDNSFLDLEPGWRLRILVPLLKAGGGKTVDLVEQGEGKTITLSASNLAGYRVSHYAVEDSGNRRVRLRFTGAETTREGKTTPAEGEPALPFSLPRDEGNIRLIYLIRASPSDHNMAIAVAQRAEALNPFTERVQRDPGACRANGEVWCEWVPMQIAVTPEKDGAAGR